MKLIDSGDYDGDSKLLSCMHNYAVIYAKNDGKIYKVSALNGSSLAPQQVSNETLADSDNFCTGSVWANYAQPAQSVYAYSLTGDDQDCNSDDDLLQLVHLDMTSTTAPISAKPIIVATADLSSGAVSGWLVNDGGTLRQCSADFASCGGSLAAITRAASELLSLGADAQLLQIDADLYVYNGQSNNLSASIFSLASGKSVGARTSDASHIYFAVGSSLYRAPLDGSAAASLFHTEPVGYNYKLEPTAHKIIYGTGLTTQEIKALDKTTAESTSLASLSNVESGYFFVHGNRIYYGFTDYNIAPPLVEFIPSLSGSVLEDGSEKAEVALSAWSIGTYPDAIDFNLGASSLQPNRMIQVGGYTSGAGMGYAGGSIQVFDAETATLSLNLGTLPSDEGISGISCLGFSDNLLCDLTSASFQTDIFYLNAAQADSLERVTNTPSTYESSLQ